MAIACAVGFVLCSWKIHCMVGSGRASVLSQLNSNRLPVEAWIHSQRPEEFFEIRGRGAILQVLLRPVPTLPDAGDQCAFRSRVLREPRIQIGDVAAPQTFVD